MIIAVGAIGGSGTRAVAQILIESEIYFGDYLNGPLDNLLFTSLFKNPDWYKTATLEEKNYRLKLFTKYMSNEHLSIKEKNRINKAAYSNPFYNSGRRFYFNVLLKKNRQHSHLNEIWGWKEPNTQIYIEEISDFFPNLKYIHVIRNGLDMAFSKNKQQLYNWGFKFNVTIKPTDDKKEITTKQLEYWNKANKYTIDTGRRLLGDNFYLLNHQKLCEQPEMEIKNLFEFLDINITNETKQKLSAIPVIPKSNNRYLKEDLSIFTKQQIAEVTDLGFNV